MLQPYELSLDMMGELAQFIPPEEPEVLETASVKIPGWETPRTMIPVCEPTLLGNELKYVIEAVETNWISSAGHFIQEFEERFAAACGTRHAVACANG